MIGCLSSMAFNPAQYRAATNIGQPLPLVVNARQRCEKTPPNSHFPRQRVRVRCFSRAGYRGIIPQLSAILTLMTENYANSLY